MQPTCIPFRERTCARRSCISGHRWTGRASAAYDAPTMDAHLFSTSVHGGRGTGTARQLTARLRSDCAPMSDFEQLVRASRLYYELGETQNAIAELLGVTRPQVSRLLKRARAEGIVEIRIVDSTRAESPAADALRRRYGLDAVHLAPTIAGPEDLTRRMVGRLASQVLRAAVRAGSIVGIGGRRLRLGDGRRARRGARRRPGRPGDADRGHGRAALRRLLVDRPRARAVPPGRRRRSAPRRTASWRRASSTTPRPGRALVAHAGVRSVLELWDRLDVALFGIGGPGWSAATVGAEVAARARRVRRRRRGPGRAVRPRGAVRLPGAAAIG